MARTQWTTQNGHKSWNRHVTCNWMPFGHGWTNHGLFICCRPNPVELVNDQPFIRKMVLQRLDPSAIHQPGFAFVLCISILHPPFPIFIGWTSHFWSFQPHETTIFHGWTENAMELHVLVRSVHGELVHQLSGEDAMVTVAALKEQLPTTSGRWEVKQVV